MKEKYTKKMFAAELILQLEKDHYSIERIAQWADSIFHQHLPCLDTDLSKIIQNIGSMTFGPEFEMSEKDLRILAIKLLKEK
ncbi:MAG: hypothetical protein ACRCYZ_04115 [Alphaproteobacteria bacterium]